MTRRTVKLMLGVLCAAVLAGCTAGPRPDESKGLPETAALIGTGPGFVYGVPSDGRVYIVYEDKVEKIQEVRKGDRFYSIGPTESEKQAKDFRKVQYYFEPVTMPGK